MGSRVVVQVVTALITLALYFLPAIIADRRRRDDVLIIALFNACIGWTGVGWLAALYWALQPNPPRSFAQDATQTRRATRMKHFSTLLTQRARRRSEQQNESS
jgi:hypothetical protein